MCNVYRRFIAAFTNWARPLNKLQKKGEPDQFELDEEHLESFKKFVDIMISPSVLALPERRLHYSVHTYTTDHVLGAALFHMHKTEEGDERKHLGYWSRTLKAP